MMDEPTYPDELTDAAAELLRDVVDAVGELTVPERVYLDDTENVAGRVHYDYDNQPYQETGEDASMFDDASIDIHGGNAVVTFHFAGPRGHWFDKTSFAKEAYDAMENGGLSKPEKNPRVGVQIRGNDIFVQNILHDATE